MSAKPPMSREQLVLTSRSLHSPEQSWRISVSREMSDRMDEARDYFLAKGLIEVKPSGEIVAAPEPDFRLDMPEIAAQRDLANEAGGYVQ